MADSGCNDILVYNPNYAQVTSKTITSNINNPSGVALESVGGELADSNDGDSGSAAEYTNRVQNSNNIITNWIRGPNALGPDGAGNIFVQNDYIHVAVYEPGYGFAPPMSLVQTLAPQYRI